MKSSYCIFNKTSETFLGLNVARAATAWSRLKGLMGTIDLPHGRGLWIAPARGVHTIGVLSPIDVIYLDSDCRVIHTIEHLRPFRIRPIRLRTASVLELPPHTIYASRTRVGDQLLIFAPEEMELNLATIKSELPPLPARKGAAQR